MTEDSVVTTDVDVHHFVQAYNFCFDGGGIYTTTDRDKSMLEDAINCYVAECEQRQAELGTASAATPTPGVCEALTRRVLDAWRIRFPNNAYAWPAVSEEFASSAVKVVMACYQSDEATAMSRPKPAATPVSAVEFINLRLKDLTEANALYDRGIKRLDTSDKIARNDREISWLKDLRSLIACRDSRPMRGGE